MTRKTIMSALGTAVVTPSLTGCSQEAVGANVGIEGGGTGEGMESGVNPGITDVTLYIPWNTLGNTVEMQMEGSGR